MFTKKMKHLSMGASMTILTMVDYLVPYIWKTAFHQVILAMDTSEK